MLGGGMLASSTLNVEKNINSRRILLTLKKITALGTGQPAPVVLITCKKIKT